MINMSGLYLDSVLFDEHPKLPGCYEVIHHGCSYRASAEGWCILALPNLRILAHGTADSLGQAMDKLMKAAGWIR